MRRIRYITESVIHPDNDNDRSCSAFLMHFSPARRVRTNLNRLSHRAAEPVPKSRTTRAHILFANAFKGDSVADCSDALVRHCSDALVKDMMASGLIGSDGVQVRTSARRAACLVARHGAETVMPARGCTGLRSRMCTSC